MNPALEAIAGSMIREINARKGPNSFDFGLGEPTLRPALAPFEAAMRWIEAHGCPYSPNAGFADLRSAIARHYALPQRDRAANVCVTNGSQEALYLAIKTLLDPLLDEVLVIEPAYPLYAKLAQLEGVACRSVALPAEHDFAASAETVLAALGPRTRMIVLGSPSNPTGRVWPRAELERLARGLAKRGGSPVWVLSDEVYRELVYTEAPPASIAEFHPWTLLTNSLSKSHALTGLRLGWMIGPEAVMSQVIKAHQFLNTAASTFSQQVGLAVFADPASFGAHRAIYLEQRSTLLRALSNARLRHVAVEGAFYAWVQLPESWRADSVAAAHALIDRCDVVTVPGRAFGGCAEGWLRLSWVGDPARLEAGIALLGQALEAPLR